MYGVQVIYPVHAHSSENADRNIIPGLNICSMRSPTHFHIMPYCDVTQGDVITPLTPYLGPCTAMCTRFVFIPI